MAHASSAAPAPASRGFLGIGFTQWILISMVVGILIGWLAPDFAPNLKPFANIFLRMIKSLIVPLLFSTLVVGIAGHGGRAGGAGRTSEGMRVTPEMPNRHPIHWQRARHRSDPVLRPRSVGERANWAGQPRRGCGRGRV